mmetsp:Transcript_5291/g.15665  ORF Transcript_5291/g.15665 Transcript_5291/m.15665 type:complete len:303 (+) Transcript_5291:101-1009(+)
MAGGVRHARLRRCEPQRLRRLRPRHRRRLHQLRRRRGTPCDRLHRLHQWRGEPCHRLHCLHHQRRGMPCRRLQCPHRWRGTPCRRYHEGGPRGRGRLHHGRARQEPLDGDHWSGGTEGRRGRLGTAHGPDKILVIDLAVAILVDEVEDVGALHRFLRGEHGGCLRVQQLDPTSADAVSLHLCAALRLPALLLPGPLVALAGEEEDDRPAGRNAEGHQEEAPPREGAPGVRGLAERRAAGRVVGRVPVPDHLLRGCRRPRPHQLRGGGARREARRRLHRRDRGGQAGQRRQEGRQSASGRHSR